MINFIQNKHRLFRFLFALFLVIQLSACGSLHHHYGRDGPPPFDVDVSKIPDAVPKVEPHSKYGNPPSYVVKGHRYYVRKSSEGFEERGIASWYGMKFYKQKTSSGEPYNLLAMTAAHRTLPLPTYVQVTNLENGRHVIVKVNDRGPFADNRVMDLSYVAAKKLGITARGTGLVDIKAIDPRHPSEVLKAPIPTASHAGHPRLYLQLGAFAERANAEKLVVRLRHYSSYPVYSKPGESNGKRIYRVQIGPLPSVESSDAMVIRLEKAGFGKPITAVD